MSCFPLISKVNNKYMKDYDKNKESPYLSVTSFEQVKEKSQFNEDFIENCN